MSNLPTLPPMSLFTNTQAPIPATNPQNVNQTPAGASHPLPPSPPLLARRYFPVRIPQRPTPVRGATAQYNHIKDDLEKYKAANILLQMKKSR